MTGWPSRVSLVTQSFAPRIVVVGMGSEWRRDDGIGPAVVRRVTERSAPAVLAECHLVVPAEDPLDLLGHWDGAELAVVVDATRSGLATGTISLIELEEPMAKEEASAGGHGLSSTHGMGLAGALRLARAVDRAPARTVVIGIEGEDFSQGSGLSPAVAAAVDRAATTVVDLVERALGCA